MAGGFQFELTVSGDTQLMRGLSRFSEGIKDLTPAFREIVKDFKEIERKQFDSSGSYGSGGWAPLSPRYAAWKDANYPGRGVLVRSGLMMESLTSTNPWTIEEIKPLSLRVGTSIPYARYHQKGGGRLPRRPIVDLTEADKTRWMKFLQAQLVAERNKAFGDMMPTMGAGQSHVSSI